MRTDKIILLTGFEPFGGETINPSQRIVEALDGMEIDGHRVVGRVMPVAFAPCERLIAEWIDELDPVLMIGLGQAGGRAELSLERIAVNLIDARICDNDGSQPVDVPVKAGVAAALFSSLPLKRILLSLRDAGIPAAISHTAGTYVCNQVFFLGALCFASLTGRGRAGFIHVPWLPEQAIHHPGQPSMELATMIEGVRLAIMTSLVHASDLSFAAGTTH